MWKFVGAALVALEVIYAVLPFTHSLLPLGGNHIAQMGIVLGTGFVWHELSRKA
jgi:hypothetical protein